MINSMLGYINLEFLNPIIDFLNAWYIPIITVLATAGVLYAIILGINLAKSDNPDKRNMAKRRIVHASLSIVIVIALTFSLRFVLANLDDWVNRSAYNQITDTDVVTQVDVWLEKDVDTPISEKELKEWDPVNNKVITKESNQSVASFVLKDIKAEAEEILIRIYVSNKKFSVVNGNQDSDQSYNMSISLKNADTENNEYRSGTVRVTIMNNNLKVGYYNITWVQKVEK